MNKLITSPHIFNDSAVAIDYLTSDQAPQRGHIDRAKLLQLKITGEDNEDQFDEFLERLLDRLKWSYDLYFICSQNRKAKQSKARSYAKLFHELRKQYPLHAHDFIDKEVELAPGYSNMAGIVKANASDAEIGKAKPLKSYFRYGLAVQKSSNTDSTADYANLLDKDLFVEDKSLSINSLKLLERYLQPYTFLYAYQFDGKDDLVFTAYIGEAVFAEVEGVISDTMGRIGLFEKQTANAKEVDEIVGLFFSQWSAGVGKPHQQARRYED